MVSFAPWRNPQAALLSKSPLKSSVPAVGHLMSVAPAAATSGNGCFRLPCCRTAARPAVNDSSSDAGSNGSPKS